MIELLYSVHSVMCDVSTGVEILNVVGCRRVMERCVLTCLVMTTVASSQDSSVMLRMLRFVIVPCCQWFRFRVLLTGSVSLMAV